MGKKSRRKKQKKEWVRKVPDEVFSKGPIKIERYGRFLHFSNTSTPEQHAAFLERAREANKEVVKDMEREVEILQGMVKRQDPVELMHRAAYVLLLIFRKNKSESDLEGDESLSLPAVEYLQYLIARTDVNINSEKLSEEEWEKIWAQVIKVFRLGLSYLLSRGPRTTPPSEVDELRMDIDGRRLIVRVRRYPIFLTDYLKTSLFPYEKQIKEIYGMEVKEIIENLEKIDEYQKRGVPKRYFDVMSLTDDFTKKLREKGYAVDPGASEQELERTRKAISSEEFKILHDEMQEKMRLTFTSAIFEITNLTSLPKAFLSLLSVKPGESILTSLTGPDHDDLSPLSPSILHHKPFLEVNDKFYTFFHSGFEDRMAEIIEADLFKKRPNEISQMAKRRSDYLESEAKTLFASIINPDFVFQNIYYPNPDDPGNLTELDILTGLDDILFIVEVKAGGFSESASRGAPESIEQELSDQIIKGQHQSERAEKYIKSKDEVAFFEENGKTEVVKIKNSKFRKIFRVIITREGLGWIGAKIANLSILEPTLTRSFPWHISIDDLRVVADLFKDDPIRFIHYLELRLIASSETTLSQNDELEHVALYNKMNHYYQLPVKGMDKMTFDPSYMREIDYYFMEKSVGEIAPVPTQEIPEKKKQFLQKLKNSKLPGRFEIGSMVLSLENPQFEEGMDNLARGRLEGKQRTFRLALKGLSVGLSITCFENDNFQEELLRSSVQMESSKCERWLVVQLTNEEEYKVSRIEILLPGRFSEQELAAVRSRHEEKVKETIVNEKTGRNEPCPCGSRKKYKKCHGK